MNRLQLRAESASEADLEDCRSWTQATEARRTAAVPAVFVPMHYERNYAYPLLVWLHGPGDDERQLRRVMPLLSMRNYVAVGPRGTCTGSQASPRQPGFAWRQTPNDILAAEQRVVESIEVAKSRFNIHEKRIFIGGYQCGGTMAVRLALQRPGLFAGAITMAGELPRGYSPLGRLNHVRKLPLLITYGRDGVDYGMPHVTRDLSLLHAAGMSVKLRQYPVADEMTTNMLTDVNAWMMEHVTGVPAQETQVACVAEGDWN